VFRDDSVEERLERRKKGSVAGRGGADDLQGFGQAPAHGSEDGGGDAGDGQEVF